MKAKIMNKIKQAANRIESEKVTLNKLFSNFWFCVPDYQRSYVWDKDQISELIDDISYAVNHNQERQYFMGSLVFHKTHENKDEISYVGHEILDGQQRLTTIPKVG
jgi:uncharacterized protein with ParB-like and HNH nuclease domain